MFGEGFVGGVIALINISSPLHFHFLIQVERATATNRIAPHIKKTHPPAMFGGGYANLDPVLQVV